ncbi:hypothetical protein B0A49_12691 [Cryomyces minteri]|uniref:DUF7730 domain-containing protein n=1 Tax=Cryomyces minteri TaxID=331657 RepID=A0A4U0VU88_9PEZI|nr:hypothetical protein B0A49_12691 [Cryomyces minteri]
MPKETSKTWTLQRRATTPTKKGKRCCFLEIPSEIRNQIYDEVFTKTTIIMAPKNANVRGSTALTCDRKLGRYRRVQGLATHWPRSLSAIILTCHQVCDEASYYLYRNSVFSFYTIRGLTNFIQVIQPRNLASIIQLRLDQFSYGEPRAMKDRIWKMRHDNAWHSACEMVVASLPRLEVLELRLFLSETPLRFDLKQPWVAPLLQFASLQNLKSVKVALTSHFSLKGGHQLLPSRRSSRRDNELKAHICAKLHHEFAEVIKRKVLGWDDARALQAYDAVFEGSLVWFRCWFNDPASAW